MTQDNSALVRHDNAKAMRAILVAFNRLPEALKPAGAP